MALVLADRVRDTTTTTGTGTVTLSGTAPTGYQNFSVIGNSNTTYYTINAGSQWEVGIGTYSSTGPTLARTTVLASSNGGSLVDFSTGTKDVFVTYPAERSVAEGYGLLPVANGGTGATTLTSGYLVKGNGTSAVSASVVYDDGTNVGIGTSSPATKLDILGAGNPTITLRGSDGAYTSILNLQAAGGGASVINATGGSNALVLQTNSSERMRIDSSGNVGIGTSAPSSRLTITGGITEIRDGNYLMLRPSGNAWDMRLQATGTQLDILSGGSLGSPIMSLLNGGNVGIGTSSPGSKLDVVAQDAIRATGFQPFLTLRDSSDANKGSRIQTASATTIFYNDTTGGGTYTERMRIDSSGNVGIGTSSPSSKLDVNGKVTLTGGEDNQLQWTNNSQTWRLNNSSGGQIYLYNVTGAKFPFKVDAATASDTLCLTSTGVGIGTSSPASLLHVKRGSSATEVYPSGTWASRVINATDASAENGLLVGNRWAANTSTIFEVGSIFGGGTGSWRSFYKVDGVGNSIWANNGTERMRLDTSGFLLVGTTAPLGGNTSNEFKNTTAGSWPLTLNANDRGLLVRNSAAGSGFYAYFEYNGGTNNGSISWSGGTTSYTTTSDARIKKNIVDAPDAGALIDAIQVRSWDFKADDVHWRYGMVAQELLPVAPEAVTVPEDEEIMMGVDYAKLVPMLIKEVQSLRARVAQLEGN